MEQSEDERERRVQTQAVMAAILFAVMRWRPEVRNDLSIEDMAESCAFEAEQLWESAKKAVEAAQ